MSRLEGLCACSVEQRKLANNACTCKVCRERAADRTKHQAGYAYRYSKVYMPMENTVVIERKLQKEEQEQMALEDVRTKGYYQKELRKEAAELVLMQAEDAAVHWLREFTEAKTREERETQAAVADAKLRGA